MQLEILKEFERDNQSLLDYEKVISKTQNKLSFSIYLLFIKTLNVMKVANYFQIMYIIFLSIGISLRANSQISEIQKKEIENKYGIFITSNSPIENTLIYQKTDSFTITKDVLTFTYKKRLDTLFKNKMLETQEYVKILNGEMTKKVFYYKRYGLINSTSLQKITAPDYEYIDPYFNAGITLAKKNQKYILIRNDGSIADSTKFEGIQYIDEGHEGLFHEYDKNYRTFERQNKIGFFDLKWNIIIDPIYSHQKINSKNWKNGIARSTFRNGVITVRRNDTLGILHHNKDFFPIKIQKCSDIEVGSFSINKIAQYEQRWMGGCNLEYFNGNRYGIIDFQGNIIVNAISNEYSEMQISIPYKSIKVKKGTYFGILDLSGHLIIPAKYDMISYLYFNSKNEVFYGVKKSGKWGVLDSIGRMLIPEELDTIKTTTRLENGKPAFCIFINNSWETIDKIKNSYATLVTSQAQKSKTDEITKTNSPSSQALETCNYKFTIPVVKWNLIDNRTLCKYCRKRYSIYENKDVSEQKLINLMAIIYNNLYRHYDKVNANDTHRGADRDRFIDFIVKNDISDNAFLITMVLVGLETEKNLYSSFGVDQSNRIAKLYKIELYNVKSEFCSLECQDKYKYYH